MSTQNSSLAGNEKFPREVGSETMVNEKEWNQNASYGHCPACGSIAMEEMPLRGDKDVTFFCSDITCKTIMGQRCPTRTKWTDSKDSGIIQRELNENYSWNDDHFPDLEIPIVCPD